MIEIMINMVVLTVQSTDMTVQHQVDGGIDTVLKSTSTTTMEDHMGLLG